MKKLFLTSVILFIAVFIFAQDVGIAASQLNQSHFEYDSYEGITQVKGTKTGFFHTEYIGDRHWFITPEGNGFFPVSLAHPLPSDCEPIVRKYYNNDQKAWADDWLKKMKDMGFNCALAGVTSTCRNQSGYVDSEMLEDFLSSENFPYSTGVWQVPHPVELKEGEERPDVFTDSYAKMIESRAAKVCGKHKDNPLLLGYYYGFGSFMDSYLWVNHLLSLPAGSPGRNALTDKLIERYKGDVKKFNNQYNKSLQKIEDLKAEEIFQFDKSFSKTKETTYKELPLPQRKDFEALIGLIGTKVYKIGHDAIRKIDTNHMIFGVYTKEQTFSYENWSDLYPYYNVASPQHINTNFSFEKLHEATGKPIMISDQTWGFVPDYADAETGKELFFDKAYIYSLLMERVVHDSRLSAIIFCGLVYDHVIGARYRYNALPGIYDEKGVPRKYLLETVTKENKLVYEKVLQPLSNEELKEIEAEYFSKRNEMQKKTSVLRRSDK